MRYGQTTSNRYAYTSGRAGEPGVCINALLGSQPGVQLAGGLTRVAPHNESAMMEVGV